ncbi:serine protease gd-like [Periplaneta americana]|uniref:serine protease gd-like n=1 Tax=Periplaneta americana TaxID=6978 RepID=UPI0037E80ED5
MAACLWLFLTVVQTLTLSWAADSSCPDVFRYEDSYGIITVPNPLPYIAIDITVEIYVTASVPSERNSNLKLVDRNAWSKLAAGDRNPVLYRLDFPLPSPLPTIKRIIVNGDVICRGSRPNSQILTTLTKHHAIYNSKCSSSSLECPDNILRSSDTFRPRPTNPRPLPAPDDDVEIIDLYIPQEQNSPNSACPDVFKYEQDRSGDVHGIISVPNPYPIVAIGISVEIYVASFATRDRKGSLELVNSLNEEWQRMRTGEKYSVLYRLNFPVSSPLPTIKSITVNNEVICQGSRPDSSWLTHTYRHSLFSQDCTSSSLDCPGNIMQTGPSFVTPRPTPRPTAPPTLRPTRPITRRPTPPPPTTRPIPPPTSRPTLPPTQEIPPNIPPTRAPERPREPAGNAGSQCGVPVERTNPLIFYGKDTKRGQWPWHAALYEFRTFDLVYICGGTFVSTRTVITAAHCVTRLGKTLNESDLVVYLGRYDLRNRKEEGSQEKEVKKVFVNPSFNTTNLEADIALLILSSTVEYTLYVRPACIWNQRNTDLSQIIGNEGVVVGWGLDEAGQTRNKLKMVKMPVVNTTTCIWSNPTFFSQFATRTSFCAGFRNGSSVCNGDSGGGMLFPQAQRDGTVVWQLRGIVSNSRPNDNDNKVCDTNNYIVFQDIAPYLDWINTLIV